MNMNHSVQYIVEKVYASGCLGKTKRQLDLLTYLLEENRAGRLAKIKEYSIAVDVIGRSKDFSPAADSIVRAEMRRLRKNLSLFNSESQNLQLDIPRARYEVIVSNKVNTKPYSPIKAYIKPMVIASSAVVLIVSLTLVNYPQEQGFVIASNCSFLIPNVSTVNSGNSTDLQKYVGHTIQSTLSRYTNIQLVEDIQLCANSGTPSFVVDYVVYETKGTYRVSLATYYEQSANVIDSTNIQGVIESFEENDDIYYSVVKSVGNLAKPYGIIPRYSITKPWDAPVIAENYGCLITMYDSYSTDGEAEYNKALACLTASIDSGKYTLDNAGGLAISYITQQRNYRTHTVGSPLASAKQLIDDADAQWLFSAEMVMAKILHETERPDYNAERLEVLLTLAEENYSENAIVLLTVGTYWGFKLGNWEKAKNVSDRVKRIHSDTDDSIFLIDAVYQLLQDSPDNLMQTCKKAYSKESVFSNLLMLRCAERTQDNRWHAIAEEALQTFPQVAKMNNKEYILSRKWDSELSTALFSANSN